MNEYNKNTIELIKGSYLAKMLRFNISFSDEKNQITMRKGNKILVLTYNQGSDLYDIEKGKIVKKFNYEVVEVSKDYYLDMIRPLIEKYFNIEVYFMDNLVIRRA